jgi:hypothetical protein
MLVIIKKFRQFIAFSLLELRENEGVRSVAYSGARLRKSASALKTILQPSVKLRLRVGLLDTLELRGTQYCSRSGLDSEL